MIRRIEDKTGRRLVIYEANEGHSRAAITSDDIRCFGDLIDPLPQDCALDLMIHSPGGDIDAAEKIVYMCRRVSKSFRVIVPEMAKSAATLIALASDVILMGLESELGPIDTQIRGPGPGGATVQHSARSFVDAFNDIKREVARTGALSPAYYPLLTGITIGFLEWCKNASKRTENFAAKWLKRYMCEGNDRKAKKIARELSDVKRWRTHGAVIDAEEAKQLGIKVDNLHRNDELWQDTWFLHCCYRTEMTRTPHLAKLFESDRVSLPCE